MCLNFTLLCYSHGCCSADSTVGTSDHKGPSHHRHIQILRLKIFRCRFIALPKHQEHGEERHPVLILLFCKRQNKQVHLQFATRSSPLGGVRWCNHHRHDISEWNYYDSSLHKPDACPLMNRKIVHLERTTCWYNVLHFVLQIEFFVVVVALFVILFVFNSYLHRHKTNVRTSKWTDLV